MERRSLLAAGVALLGIGSAARAQVPVAQHLTAEDHLQIQQLYSRYCHALDMGEGRMFADCFTPDGEFRVGAGTVSRKGTAALIAMGSVSGTRHFTANLLLTPNADGTVAGSVYLLLYNARTDPPSLRQVAIYDDLVVRTANGWKFKRRTVWHDGDPQSPFKPKPLAPKHSP